MFEKRIDQLLKQQQNSNDVLLLNLLKKKFSETNENSPLSPFYISGDWDILHVQKVLNSIDSRLFAVENHDNSFLISM